MKPFIAFLILFVSVTANATKPTPPKEPTPEPVTPTTVTASPHAGALSASGALSDADARAAAQSAAQAASQSASRSDSTSGAASGSSSATGPVTVDTGGNVSNTHIDYDFPPDAAVVFAQECQDGAAAGTRSFSINRTGMNATCLFLMGARAKFQIGALMDCGTPESIAKGASPIRTPTMSDCERLQRKYFDEGIALIDEGMSLLQREPGHVKKLWRWLW